MFNFIRYPGGKGRMLDFIIPQISSYALNANHYVEPFVGGGSVFFALSPNNAILSDINPELIDLYKGIRFYPKQVWDIFKNFPATRKAYYKIRELEHDKLDLKTRSARTLYLNRTCFKGMWRYNSRGEFNVGYGGQERRWVIDEETLNLLSKTLQRANLKCCDFEEIICECKKDDFIFLDPPYSPGEFEMKQDHYRFGKFHYNDYKRLANALNKAHNIGVHWAMTITSHPEILSFFNKYHIIPLPKGTSRKLGIITNITGEVLIRNYNLSGLG